jgi:LPPG:FO 2-phospho-L-lactate transferase
MADARRGVVLLAGGVGGAKLAHGLQAHLGDRLTVVVNTADDLERHGLLVMPDHDTVMYTLAGISNREWGWGIEGETFAAAEMLARYGEETWFRLGDRDLATHIVRTARIRAGGSLSRSSSRRRSASRPGSCR